MVRSNRPGLLNTLAGLLAAFALILLLAISFTEPAPDSADDSQPVGEARPSAVAASPTTDATQPAQAQRFVLRDSPGRSRDLLIEPTPGPTLRPWVDQMPILRGERTAPMPILPGERTAPMPGAPLPQEQQPTETPEPALP